jgi:hypothetical protein
MTSINYPSYAENTNTDNFQVVGYNETTQAVERKNLGSAIDAKIVASSGAVQSAYQLIPQLIFKWFDDNNDPADGWLITSYEAGTTTKIDTYSDDIGTLNDNPITLNDRGEARIFLDSTLVYKFVITDALGGNVQTFDNITGVGGVSSGGGGSVAGNVGDLQLNKDGVNFGASGLNWSGGVLTINNSGTGSFTQDYSDLSRVTTTTAYGTGSVTQVVQSGAVSATLTGSAGALALVSDATRQSITMGNVSITSDAQSSFGLGVVLGGGLALVDGSVDYTGGVFRFRENGVTRGFNATSITYDNSTSGLTATDVKTAIDELNTNANTLTMETITTSELNTALVAKPDGVGGVTWGTDSALPAGATTEVQVNVGGVFGAYSSLTYDGNILKTSGVDNEIRQEDGAGYRFSRLNSATLREDVALTDVSVFNSYNATSSYESYNSLTGSLGWSSSGSAGNSPSWNWSMKNPNDTEELRLNIYDNNSEINLFTGTGTNELEMRMYSGGGRVYSTFSGTNFELTNNGTDSQLSLSGSGAGEIASLDSRFGLTVGAGGFDVTGDGDITGDLDVTGSVTSDSNIYSTKTGSSSSLDTITTTIDGYHSSERLGSLQSDSQSWRNTGIAVVSGRMDMNPRFSTQDHKNSFVITADIKDDFVPSSNVGGQVGFWVKDEGANTMSKVGRVNDDGIFGTELHADNGFTGTGSYTSFTIVDGIITSAS